MSSIVITAEDVFSESDAERPCATIGRIGGGRYSVIGFIGGNVAGQGDFDTLAEAEAAGRAHADRIDATPTTSDEKVTLTATIREQAATISVLQAQIEALQAAAVKGVTTADAVVS